MKFHFIMNNSHRGSFTSFGNPESRLWKPIQVGNYELSHRVVLAPLTRHRAINGIPNDMHVEYYEQRTSSGGLLITEGTFISYKAGGFPNAPGIYTPEQLEAWKKVTAAVHRKGGVISCQLWAIGRANRGKVNDIRVVGPSTIPFEGGEIPERLSVDEIKEYINDYRQAALNAIQAGFDMVEIHSAHGYFLDQFIQKSSNDRLDAYGGSLENRARFLLEALEAVCDAVGQKRVAFRISPFSEYLGMGKEENVFETFGYICKQVKQRFPSLAYVSITDPRLDSEVGGNPEMNKFTSDYFRAIFRGIDPEKVDQTSVFDEPSKEHPTLFLAAGGYAASDAEPSCDRTGDLIGFGRFFISNPDLPYRLKNGLSLNPYDRSTFYTQDAAGFTDYPFADDNTPKFVPLSREKVLELQLEQLQNENKQLKQEKHEFEIKVPDLSLLKEPINSHRGSGEYGLNPDSRVWKTVKCGKHQLEHRIVMAPLTRMRAIGGVPQKILAEYYAQRATKGGLLISEATFIAKEAGGYPDAPVIETREQVEAWKQVTAAVHEKGGFISCQLWAIGRANVGEMPDVKIVSSSSLPTKSGTVPEQMTIEDIKRYLEHYRKAALNAIEAGFDFVEVHGAHGYLLEQFLRPDINCTRNDEYSGPIENRARFMLEALQVVVNAVGPERAAIRISPFTSEEDVDPYEHWGYLVEKIREKFPKLSYLSMTDPRLDPDGTKQYSSDFFRAILRGYNGPISKFFADEHVRFDEPNDDYPTLFLSAGGYTASDAEPCGDRTGDLIGYGRIYIANPDLVHRLKHGLVLNPYDRSTFYSKDDVGYTDYPFADETTPKFVPLTKRPVNEVLKEIQTSHDKFMDAALRPKIEVKTLKLSVEESKKNLDAKVRELSQSNSKFVSVEQSKEQLAAKLEQTKAELVKIQEQYRHFKEFQILEKENVPKQAEPTKENQRGQWCLCQ